MKSQFERVWCIQEIWGAHNAIIRIVSLSVRWDIFAAGIWLMQIFHIDVYLPQSAVKAIELMNSLRYWRSVASDKDATYGLLILLRDTREFKSTLLSGKIYGILPFVEADLDLPVDYAMEAALLYKQLALNALDDKDNGDPGKILYSCNIPYDPPVLKLPSWIPDWSRRIHCDSLFNLGLASNASRSRQPMGLICLETDQLPFCGWSVDKIAVIDEIRAIPSVMAFKNHAFPGPEQIDIGMTGIGASYRNSKRQYDKALEEYRNNESMEITS
jgi:hypothetical protein